ncbi:MAG: hypothetical protein IKT03_01055 [Muribaculaceae bacterium]|nr:hypothetical protein [Muribaculaceae bacterium]
MNKKTVKFLKIVCYVMLALIPLWLIFYGIQSYFVLTTGSGEGVINWDSPRIGLKVTFFILHHIAMLTMAGLFTAFLINILRYLKDGTIFSRANVILLWVMVLVLPIYSFLSDNMDIACSTKEELEIVITDNVFLYPLVALIIAFLYKIAYDVAEEQKLTI